MKRIYFTAVPLESNFVLEHKRVCPVGFELPGAPEQTAYPITAIIAATAEPGDDVLVIAVRQSNAARNANLDILNSELASLQLPHLRCRDLVMPESQDRDVLTDLFRMLIEAAEPSACYYACMTFGTKTFPIVLFSALSYVDKIVPDTEIKGIYYQEIRREQGVTAEARLYDVSPLFLLNRVVDTVAAVDGAEPAALIAALLGGRADG